MKSKAVLAAVLVVLGSSSTPLGARQLDRVLDEDATLDWVVEVSTSALTVDQCLGIDAAGERVFALTKGSYPQPGSVDSLFALSAYDAEDGTLLWRTPEVGGVPQLTPELVVASADGTSVFVAGKFNEFTTVGKYDAATGALLWGVLLPSPPIFGESVEALDVSADGSRVAVGRTRLHFFSSAVATTCLDGIDGSLLWSVEEDDPSKSYEVASRVVVDTTAGRVHVSANTQTGAGVGEAMTFSYDLGTGALAWFEAYSGSNGASPGALAADSTSGQLYLGLLELTGGGGATHTLVAFDAASGVRDWTAPTVTLATAIAVRPGGTEVAASGSGTGDPVVEAFATSTGSSTWTGTLATGTPLTPFGVRGLEYSATGAEVALGLSGDYLPSGATVEQELVAAVFETTGGGLVWSRAEDRTSATGGEVAETRLVATSSGPRLVAGSEVNTGTTVNVRFLALDAGTGVLDWEATESSLTPQVRDSILDVALSPDGTVAFAVGNEAQAGASFPSAHVRAVDAADGTELWATALASVVGNDLAVALSPLGDVVYAAGFGSSVPFSAAALDATTGAVLWQRSWTGPAGFQIPRALELSPDGSQLFLCGQTGEVDTMTFEVYDRARIYALDASTGVEVWTEPYSSSAFEDATGWSCALLPDGTRVFLVGETEEDLFVRSLDAATGVEDWTERFDLSTALGGAPARDVGLLVSVDPSGASVYVTGTANAVEHGGTVLEPLTVAFDATTGSQLWVSPASAAELTGTSYFTRAGALASDGSALFSFSMTQAPGTFEGRFVGRALDTGTGALLWQRVSTTVDGDEVGDLALSADDAFLYASASTSYFATAVDFEQGQRVFRFDTETGEEYWSVDRSGDTNSASSAGGLAVADGFVLVAGATHLAQSSDDGFLERYSTRPLSSAPAEISLAAGGAQKLALDATAASGGEFYLVLGSYSGTSPGIPVQGGFTLPLQSDAYFKYSLKNPNTGALVDTLGSLDGAGRAEAAIVWPAGLDPALAGLTFHHAFVAFDPSVVVSTVSNASSLVLVL